MKDSVVHDKSRSFSARILKMHRYLKQNKVPATICDQVLRSGTAVAANLAEARYGLTKKDFLYKVSVSLKECNETLTWINLLYDAGYLTSQEYESIKNDCEELCKIMAAIIKTTQNNLKK